MAWLLIFFQAMLGLFDGYVFMPSKKPAHRLLSVLLIDIPTILIVANSVEPYGITMALYQVAAHLTAKILVWYTYGKEKYYRVL